MLNSITILSASDIPIPELGLINNFGFLFFLCCFFLIVFVFGREPRLGNFMLEELFKRKDNKNLFAEPLSHTLSYKRLLSVQNVIVSTLFLYVVARNYSYITDLSLHFFFEFVLNAFLLILLFVLYKLISTSIVGYAFFEKEQVYQWKENFYSILSLSGLSFFLPVLLAFYNDSFFLYCLYFILFILVFAFFLLNYRIYITFFQQKNRYVHFILYLCGQEIIPLYVIYKGIVYLFSIAQKDCLWIQL